MSKKIRYACYITAQHHSNLRLQWAGQERELDCVSKLINKPDAPLLFNFEKLN